MFGPMLLVILFLLITGISHFIGIGCQFFQWPPHQSQPVKGTLLVIVLFIFFAFNKVFPFGLELLFYNSSMSQLFSWNDSTIKMASYTLSSLSILYLIFLFNRGNTPKPHAATLMPLTSPLNAIKQGVATFFFGITAVGAVSLFMQILVAYLFHHSGHEQPIITYIKENYNHWSILTLGALNIILLGPITEEIVFRGFLQRYLSCRVTRSTSILLTSTLFAFVHYSPLQGVANLPLLSSIFVLSLYLGFVYEKTLSIIAPIAMHVLFNLEGVVRLYLMLLKPSSTP